MCLAGFPCGSMVKNLPAMQETWVRCLGGEDLLEKEMAAHSRILVWEIPGTEKPGRLQSMGLQKNWTHTHTHTHTHPHTNLDWLLPRHAHCKHPGITTTKLLPLPLVCISDNVDEVKKKNVKNLHVWNVFNWLSHLVDNLAGYRILALKLPFSRILKTLFNFFVASGNSTKVDFFFFIDSESILILGHLYINWFFSIFRASHHLYYS